MGDITMQINSGGARSGATALPDHERKYGFIENQSTNILYLRFGEGCTTTNYDISLKACTATADGSGGAIYFEENGLVTIAGTSPSYTAYER